MTRRNAWTAVLVVMAITAALCLLTQPDADAATSKAPNLASFDYGDWAKGSATLKFLQSPEFHTGGAYREIDVIESFAFVRKQGYPCAPYTVQLFRVLKDRSVQVGSARSYGCPAVDQPEAQWYDVKDGTYFVLNTCTVPKRSDVCGTGGTVIYGRP